MKPVYRLLTVREQKILQQAERLGFECQVRTKNTNLPRYQADDYQNLAGGREQNLQNPRFIIRGKEEIITTLEAHRATQGPWTISNYYQKLLIMVKKGTNIISGPTRDMLVMWNPDVTLEAPE